MKKFGYLLKNNFNAVFLIAVICSLFLTIASVSASSYTSYLSLGNGKYVIGATRYYTAGKHTVMTEPTSLTNYGNKGYTKLHIVLAQDNGNSSTYLSSATQKIFSTNVCITSDMGYQNASNKYYTFSTKVDGVVYGGVYAKKVLMES